MIPDRCATLRAMIRSLLLMVWMAGGSITVAFAQFHALGQLPWCPPRPDGLAGAQQVTDEGRGSVLRRIDEALQAGQYREVVDQLYAEAVREGYQRNASLYDHTRQALRRLLVTDQGEQYWPRMQQLYAARTAHVGRDEYAYRNTLLTRAWCDQQLDNERLAMLAQTPGREGECVERAQQLLAEADGRTDPARVTQGLFAPLARAEAQPSAQGLARTVYADVLRWLEASEQYVRHEHPDAYEAYYATADLGLMREACRQRLSADSLVAAMEERRHQLQQALQAASDSVAHTSQAWSRYAEAADLYRQRRLAEAYARINDVLRADPTLRAAHLLQAGILQAAAHDAAAMADRVAFWCAAYEAGQGYADAQTQAQLLSALRGHLFMSGLAGQWHTTRSPFVIRQRVFTLEQLRSL